MEGYKLDKRNDITDYLIACNSSTNGMVICEVEDRLNLVSRKHINYSLDEILALFRDQNIESMQCCILSTDTPKSTNIEKMVSSIISVVRTSFNDTFNTVSKNLIELCATGSAVTLTILSHFELFNIVATWITSLTSNLVDICKSAMHTTITDMSNKPVRFFPGFQHACVFLLLLVLILPLFSTILAPTAKVDLLELDGKHSSDIPYTDIFLTDIMTTDTEEEVSVLCSLVNETGASVETDLNNQHPQEDTTYICTTNAMTQEVLPHCSSLDNTFSKKILLDSYNHDVHDQNVSTSESSANKISGGTCSSGLSRLMDLLLVSTQALVNDYDASSNHSTTNNALETILDMFKSSSKWMTEAYETLFYTKIECDRKTYPWNWHINMGCGLVMATIAVSLLVLPHHISWDFNVSTPIAAQQITLKNLVSWYPDWYKRRVVGTFRHLHPPCPNCHVNGTSFSDMVLPLSLPVQCFQYRDTCKEVIPETDARHVRQSLSCGSSELVTGLEKKSIRLKSPLQETSEVPDSTSIHENNSAQSDCDDVQVVVVGVGMPCQGSPTMMSTVVVGPF